MEPLTPLEMLNQRAQASTQKTFDSFIGAIRPYRYLFQEYESAYQDPETGEWLIGLFQGRMTKAADGTPLFGRATPKRDLDDWEASIRNQIATMKKPNGQDHTYLSVSNLAGDLWKTADRMNALVPELGLKRGSDRLWTSAYIKPPVTEPPEPEEPEETEDPEDADGEQETTAEAYMRGVEDGTEQGEAIARTKFFAALTNPELETLYGTNLLIDVIEAYNELEPGE